MTLLMGQNGYFDASTEAKEYVREYLKKASCIDDQNQSKIVLSYTNLANNRRNGIVFGFSIGCMILFLAAVIYAWHMGGKKRGSTIYTLHHLIVILGMLLMLTSFLIYWWPASSTTICRARYWTLSLGYVNVISAVFIWAFIIHYLYSKEKIPHNFSYSVVGFTYAALNFINLILLLLWTLAGLPISREIVVDVFAWTTRYECYSQVSYPDYIVTSYHLLISIVGCVFIYRLWKSKNADEMKQKTPDDIRFLMICLYNQISVFLLLFVIKNMVLTDDLQYQILIPLFLFLIANVTFSLFVPRIFNKLLDNISGNTKVEGGQTRSDNNSKSNYRVARTTPTNSGSEPGNSPIPVRREYSSDEVELPDV
jgi:hypothetical protein